MIEFKTDNADLFFYTLHDVLLANIQAYEILFCTMNLYALTNNQELINNVPTEYEQKFIAKNTTIKKLF